MVNHICRRRISNILTMELGWWGRVLAVKETCLLLGGLSQWLTRIRDTRGWKYLHSRTSLTSSPLLRLTLGFNGRSTRYYAAAESTLAPTFLCLPPLSSYVVQLVTDLPLCLSESLHLSHFEKFFVESKCCRSNNLRI